MSEAAINWVGLDIVPCLTPIDFSAPRLLLQTPTLMWQALLEHAKGLGYIASTVEKQVDNDPAPSPVSRRVVLLVEPTLQQVAETWSDPVTGAYRFDGLSMAARFTVVAYDHLGSWRAVIADGLAAKAVQP